MGSNPVGSIHPLREELCTGTPLFLQISFFYLDVPFYCSKNSSFLYNSKLFSFLFLMIRIERTTMVLLIVLVSICLPAYAQNGYDDYSESYVLTVTWCHYLEFVQEFTNHTFLVYVHSNDTPSTIEFMFIGRSHLSNFSIIFNSSSDRYRTIIFEVYELIDDLRFPCDLTKETGIQSAEILYDTYTGHWAGDDALGDESGHGRLNGCDDGSFYSFERDFELCFRIDVVDPDGDAIPRWVEQNVYATDIFSNDANRDDDHDEIPLYWEWKYGFDPFVYEDHRHTDIENDGLSNYEEYLVFQWNSDPFRKDIFLEIDQMEPKPGYEGFLISPNTIVRVYQTFAQRNIMFHVDDGCMGGGEILPFDSMVWFGEEKQYYRDYFLHNDPGNWRRGVFRYALYVNDHYPIPGMEFPGENSIIHFFKPGLNSYVISTSWFKNYSARNHSYIMLHELGHTLGIYMSHPWGCDNQLMRNPFSIQRILFKNYRSVMNYQYTNKILDYSDGSHGFGDYDDWGKMDLTFFQP